MAIASSVGLGSGIDINSLVTQLVSSEGQPAFNAINRQETAYSTRLSGLGTLKSALSDFQSVVSKLKDGSLFKTHQATSSNESVLKVTAGAGSVAGSHAIEVTQLAKTQNSITTAEFVNGSAVVGNGSLTFTAGSGASFNLTVDSLSGNNTLSSLATAINSASGNSFIKASIINVDNANSTGTISKLVLTAKDSGTVNAFTVSGTDGDGIVDNAGLSRIFSANLFAQTPASNAVIKVDGQTATRSSNTMTDVLQGVTLDLKSELPGTQINVNVNLDNEAIKKTISDFVTAYNKFSATTKSLGKYGGSSDGSGNGALIGDSTLRYVSTQVRQYSVNTVSSATGDYNSLAMVGIKIDKDGVMSLDSSKLNSALSANLQSVSEVFASSDGVATRLNTRLNEFLQSGGPLDSQESSLKKRLSGLQDKRSDVQSRLDSLEKSLLKQFTAMDIAVGQFRNTGSFISNWVNSL